MGKVLEYLNEETVDIKIVPDLLKYMNLQAGVEELDGLPIINLTGSPLYGWNTVLKRFSDIVLSALAIIISAPLLLLLAIMIKLGSRGPVIFKQERVGLDGKSFKIINTAQDHKRAFDGDKGPNTGGMGAYSPTPLSTSKLLKRVSQEIIQPTLNAMIERGHPYTGFLYIGLMIVDGDPYVIEFNVRMGDPETQVVLPLMKSSLFELLWNATEGKLKQTKVRTSSQTAVTVVMASEGYPGKYKKGMRIKGLDQQKNRLIFHAGTRQDSHDTLTTGGRVLNAVGFGKDLPSAISDAYDIVKALDFNGKYYRRDIGQRGIKYLKKLGKYKESGKRPMKIKQITKLAVLAFSLAMMQFSVTEAYGQSLNGLKLGLIFFRDQGTLYAQLNIVVADLCQSIYFL